VNSFQRAAFNREIAAAKELIAQDRLESSLRHLERAHVIGQAFVVPHAMSHGLMLSVELRRRRTAAALGQIARLALGLLGSAIGIVPVGNTGGSDVGMFKRMAIAPELQKIIDGVPVDPPV
jgi:hypothetical protein